MTDSDEIPAYIAITKVRAKAIGGLVSELTVKDHAAIIADEPLDFVIGDPVELAGTDKGWTPVQYQLAALISCANVATMIVANDQSFALDGLEIRAQSNLDLRGLITELDRQPRFEHVGIEFRIATNEPPERIEALAQEADRRCPQLGLFHAAGVPITQTWTRDGEVVCVMQA